MQSASGNRNIADALREYFAQGLSFLQIATAINAKFNTAYSRSAVIGRARRMGLAGRGPAPWTDRRTGRNGQRRRKRRGKSRTRAMFRLAAAAAGPERAKASKLRCVEIAPRHLSLVDLEAGDCRYPYGGDEDGEAITFCGHPRREGSSYCTPHFHLTRGPGTASERAAGRSSLRLVEAA